jgi:propionyl-CoA synthetase
MSTATALLSHKSRYREVYERSMLDPVGFWGEAAEEIDWYEKAAKVFDAAAGV